MRYFHSQAGSKKNIFFRLPLERAQRDICTHLGAQSDHMGSTMEHFGCILEVFRRSTATEIFATSLQPYSKKQGCRVSPDHVFWYSSSSCTQEHPRGYLDWNFCGFLRILMIFGCPRAFLWSSFSVFFQHLFRGQQK